MIQGSRAQEVRNYRINPKTVKKNPNKIVQDVKNMVDWYNKSIDRSIKSGVPKKYLPAGGKKIKKTGIRGVKSAERALAKIKNLAWSDIASPRDYKKLIRDAEKIYGKRKFKLIKDPTRAGHVVAVPVGTNEGAESPLPSETFSDMISKYWDWYERIGSQFFDSDEAMTVLDKALEVGDDPVEFGQHWIRENYADLLSKYSDVLSVDGNAGSL